MSLNQGSSNAQGDALLGRILRLAGTVAFARLGIMGMGVVDTIMVGQFAPDELADQALGWAPTGVLVVGGIGLLTGVQVLTAAAMGQGASKDGEATLHRGLMLAVLCGFAACPLLWFGAEPALRAAGVNSDLSASAARVAHILALSIPTQLMFIAGSYFLEGIERPLPATIVMWIANILNLALNFLFVPEHGAIGSAWATVAARVFLAAALLAWIWRLQGPDLFASRRLSAALAGYGPLLAIGGAAALSQVAEAGAFSGMTVLAARLSEDSVAAYQVLLNMLAVVFMIALGFAAAASVVTAEALSSGQPSQARRAGWMALGLNTLGMIVCGAVLWVFGEGAARLYTSDAMIAGIIAGAMGLLVLVLVFDGAQVVLAQTLRARRDNLFPTASHILAYVIVMPPLAFVLAEVQGRGVGGLMESILAASILSALVLTARLLALTRPKSSLLPLSPAP